MAIKTKSDTLPDPNDASARDRATEVMTQWVAAIADQVKNPVAGIAAAVDILDREIQGGNGHTQSMANATVETAISMIRSRLEQLNHYVTELASVARPAFIKTSPWPTQQLINQAIGKTRSRIPSNTHLTVLVDQSDGTVYCDSAKFESMLSALILNGVEAVEPSRNPEISIIAKRIHEQPSGVRFDITDNGCGIPEHLIPMATKPFWSTKEAGTGLGLTLCEKYVQAHGGWLTISRAAQTGGTSVTIFIPDQSSRSKASAEEAQNS